ncbi:MAG: peroxiredoxin [Planctomycetes bacterium]|nr:peroxiredoxin [Planctomycetota bacterium]
MAVQVGSPAPKFKAQAYLASNDSFKEVSLDDYKDKWLVLYFYPLDFTFVCPTEIVTFDKHVGDFKDRGAEVVACSIDSQYSHKGWCASHKDLKGLKHAMLADITKRISMDYGVLLPEKGIALRGTFIIDPKGNVRWASVNDTAIGRNVEEVVRVLDALQTEKLCPCDWKKGEKTLN